MTGERKAGIATWPGGRHFGNGACGALELHADNLAYPVLLHSHTINHVCGGNRAFIVRDHDELGILQEPLEHSHKAIHIGFIQWRIQLVQYAEGTWFDLVNGEQQRHSRHGLLATGEQSDASQLLPGRTGQNINPAFKHIAVIDQRQIGFATPEDFHKQVAEVFTNLVEGFHKHLPGLGIDLIDHFQKLFFGLGQIVMLVSEELVPLLGFLVFIDRHQVDRTNLVQSFLE